MTAIGSIGGVASMATKATAPASTAAPGLESAGLVADPGSGFGTAVAGALEQLQASQSAADQLAVKASTGDLQDAHEFLIAATQASLATEMTVAVRNRAVEAFTSIMQMGV